MAFNFQNPPNTGLSSSTPAKQTGFGNFSFGGQPQTGQAAPAFGQQQQQNAVPTFGTPATNTNAFGQQQPTAFGAASTAPAFGTQTGGAGAFGAGTGFGGQPSSAPPFGTTQTVSTSTGFGATPSFGIGTGFGGTTSTVPTLSGFGGFGNTTTTTAPSLFGNIGSAAPVQASTGFAGFGNTSTTTSAPTFSGFGTSNTGFGSFGTSFGTTFGKPPATTTSGFGGFGAGFNFSQPGQQQPFMQQQQQPFMQQQQQQQQQQLNPDEAFAQSIFNVSIYGDERDTIIAKWNYLQAMWGTGKAFYSNSALPIDITPQNYLCRFKTMGYSRLPGKDNKIGLVGLTINKPSQDIQNQQQQLITSLHQIFGNKPNIVIVIDSIKQLEDKTQVDIYVEEKSQQIPNESKRILATDINNFLNQPNIKQQLSNLGIEKVLALVLPDEDQLKEYLETPPKGIDPRMWRQARIDNPDDKKFIPVPMIGFNELKWRIKCQENETDLHAQYLTKLEKDLAELKQRHASSTAKIIEHRRKLAELSHKILKIVVKQECTRKVGMALSPEEEVLRSKLENMHAVVSAPTQFKGRLSELLSQVRMRRNQFGMAVANEYTLDRDSEDEMKSFLTMQQNAMKFLIETVNKDLKALNIITEGMPQLTGS